LQTSMRQGPNLLTRKTNCARGLGSGFGVFGGEGTGKNPGTVIDKIGEESKNQTNLHTEVILCIGRYPEGEGKKPELSKYSWYQERGRRTETMIIVGGPAGFARSGTAALKRVAQKREVHSRKTDSWGRFSENAGTNISTERM